MKYELTQNYDMPELASFYDKYFPIGHKQYTFVEIGANDGVVASKTIDLARRFEWSGIYVEPIPFFAEKCRNLHSTNEKIIETFTKEEAKQWLKEAVWTTQKLKN